MASKSHELFEIPSAAAKAEATPTNFRPTEDHAPDMGEPVEDQEKEVQYIREFKLFALLGAMSVGTVQELP